MARRIHITHLADRTAAEAAVFGQPIVPDRYGDLAGDITGDGVVTVSYNETYAAAGVPYAVTVRAWSPVHTAIVRLNPDDFQYAETKVHYPRQGTGRLICKLIATTALEFQFATLQGNGTRIVGAANPANNANGFYTYPTYGFDAPIVPNQLLAPLPANLNHHASVLELIQTLPGRDFWRANGHALPTMSFDLDPASLSWRTLKILAL